LTSESPHVAPSRRDPYDHERTRAHPFGVVRVIEVVGSSPNSG
jgi:hypothetical protein